MADPTLDDQLKLAQIEKTRAETEKLRTDASVATRQASGTSLSELIKIGGAVILGIGGAVAAYTQYEVAALKAQIAEEHREEAAEQLEQARKATDEATAVQRDAVAKRDAAVKERLDAEAAVKELRDTLTALAARTKEHAPQLVQSRLAYVQFRGATTRAVINDLRAALERAGFDAPGAERVAGEYDSLVKYFTPADAADAKRLTEAVEAFFASKDCQMNLRTIQATAPQGQEPPLEVWLALPCR